MKKKIIFNFNHIDKNISSNELEEIKALYKFYHRLFWCHKASYKDFLFKSISLTLISTSLITGGTIVGGITLNPIILGVITGSGVIVTAFQKKKNYEAKIKASKYAFKLYEKVLIALRTHLRGEFYNHSEFIHEMNLFDDIVSDLAPFIDKYKKQYDKNIDTK